MVPDPYIFGTAGASGFHWCFVRLQQSSFRLFIARSIISTLTVSPYELQHLLSPENTNQSGTAVAGFRAEAAALERGSPASQRSGEDRPNGIQPTTDTQAPGPVGVSTGLSRSDGSATLPLSSDMRNFDLTLESLVGNARD